MHSKMTISPAGVLRAAFVAISVALLAACGSDSTGPKNANVAGTYDLTTVNSSSLPYTVPNTGANVEVVQQATLTLVGDSTYAVNANGTLNGSASTLVADAGHYSVSGSQVTFTSTAIPGAHYTANATGSTLTATIAGAFVGSSDVSFTLVFTKTS